MSKLDNFRHNKDEFFKNDPHSPLTHEQKHHFSGLNYFNENPDLVLTVNIEEFPKKDLVNIQTSTGENQTYQRYGKFTFDVNGKSVDLILYTSDNEFFLPFTDGLSGKETYGAGRYLEPIDLGNGRLLIDFNYAYNPYCAYNELWSCPISPAENRLKVPIKAGEMIFESH
jgi:uncharacterized protein (DUF1684 family)